MDRQFVACGRTGIVFISLLVGFISTSECAESFVNGKPSRTARADTWDDVGQTVLHAACCNTRSRQPKILLPNGADVKAQRSVSATEALSRRQLTLGDTQLHITCQLTDIDRVKLLLDQGAKVNGRNSLGETPLHIAVQGRRKDVVELLLARGADPNLRDDRGRTPLHFACAKGHVETVELLLNHGAHLDAKNDLGRTPFYGSVGMNKPEMVRFLLAKGANLNDRDKSGMTPLYVACYGPRSVPLVNLLIAEGARVNVADDQGRTPLHAVGEAVPGIRWRCRPGVVKALLAAGADVHAVDRFGFAPLHGPSLHGCDQVVKELLGKDRTLSREEQTALHAAALDGRLKIAEMLLSRGADVNARYCEDFLTMMRLSLGDELFEEVCRDYPFWPGKDRAYVRHLLWPSSDYVVDLVRLIVLRETGFRSNDATALHFACFTGQTEMVEFLLSKGASVSAVDAQGHTALHVACAMHNCQAVKDLLASGAEVNAKDHDGLTSYDWVRKMDSAVHSLEGTPKHKFFSSVVNFNKASTKQLVEVLEAHGGEPSVRKDAPGTTTK